LPDTNIHVFRALLTACTSKRQQRPADCSLVAGLEFFAPVRRVGLK
jgi:hypothetical protein